MKVLSISTDRKLFEEESAVFYRSKDYASKMEELHIIVFSLKKHNFKEKIIENLHLYPTNSTLRLFYISDAIKIGKKFFGKNFVITAQDPFETGIVGYFLKKRLKARLQIQIHTDFLSPYFKKSFLNRIRVVVAKRIIPKADSLRVVSSVIFDSIKNKFPNLKAEVDILPIFVDVSKFEKAGESESKVEARSILMLSRFSKEKRIDLGLEVFKKVKEKYENVRMTIVGSGSEKNNIERKIKDLSIAEFVNIIEWQSDVESAYKKADVFLLTSEYEGYGMTLIEAGAAGCPIVTTKVGIAKTDIFQNSVNSFVCPVGDVDCLSKGIVELLSNETKRKSFSDNMRESIKSLILSKEEYTNKYVSLLEKILKNV